MKFDPVAVWIGIFQQNEFNTVERETLIEIANRLTDLGYIPEHDSLQQTYRTMGYESECDFWAAHQPGLPFEKKAPGSLRRLELVTGHSRQQLGMRRLRIMGPLSQPRDNRKGKKNAR